MMLPPNPIFARADEIGEIFAPAVVDIFAGCGGWSIGTEQAFVDAGWRDRRVDLMVNHWQTAVDVHSVNHPLTQHLRADVLEVDPLDVLPGRRIAYLHASPDCFPAGTLILTATGYRPIESLAVGDLVLTHAGRWRPVTATMQSHKPVRFLRTHGHPGLLVSDEHPFFARHHPDVGGEAVWLPAKSLYPGLYVAAPRRAEMTPAPVSRVLLKRGIWWLIGQYLADGWARLDDQHAEVCITVGKHEAETMAQEFFLRTNLKWAERDTETAHQFTCCDRELATFLREHFGHLAQNKTLPGWVLGLPAGMQRELLNGYLLGDGCHKKAGVVELSTTGKALAFGMKTLLNILGHSVSVFRDENNRGGVIDGRKIKSNFPLWCVRYRPDLTQARRQSFGEGPHEFCQVRDVSGPSSTPVDLFNISVAEDESYVVEGIVVHNCTDHSKAKGGKPRRKEIRALADVVIVWAAKRRPNVITLENVEEFEQWGPLQADGQPDKGRRGQEFARWKGELESLGYEVQHRVLRACDYGAPTTRKRLFVVARCDGKPVVWPERTHAARADQNGSRHKDEGGGQRNSRRNQGCDLSSRTKFPSQAEEGRVGRSDSAPAGGRLEPHKTAAECIDWSIPMLSIFATPEEAKAFGRLHGTGTPRRPLKPKTLARIAGGLDKFVLKAAKPFIVTMANGAFDTAPSRILDPDLPFNTVTGCPKHAAVDVTLSPFTAGCGGRAGQSPETSVGRPLPTVTGKADRVVAAATLAPYSVPRYGERPGQPPRSQSIEQPAATITGTGNGTNLVAAVLSRYNGQKGNESRCHTPADPVSTLDTQNRIGLVAALVTKHYSGVRGSAVDEPLHTVTACDHNAVTCAYLSHFYGSNTRGGEGDPLKPAKTITSGGQHAAVTVALATPLHIGEANGTRDHRISKPLRRSEAACAAAPQERREHHTDEAKREPGDVLYGPGHSRADGPSEGQGSVRGNDRVDSTRGIPSGQGSIGGSGNAVPYLIGTGGATYAAKPKSAGEPANTVMANDRRAIVAAFLAAYYGEGSGLVGHSPAEPLPTATGTARFGLVTVTIDGTTYVVTDIAMRMLTPRELANAQGFPVDYVIDRTADGKPVSKANQVKLIGNAVPPAFARAIVKANVVDQGVLGEPVRPRKRRAARKAVLA